MINDQVSFYEKMYGGQTGGGGDFPVFQGAKYYQYGHGFGDVLRGIFRVALPVVARGASNFLSEMLGARNSGMDWKSAAKSAIAPTANTVINDALGEIQSRVQQGKGRRKRSLSFSRQTLYKGPKRKKSKQSRNIPSQNIKYNF